MEKETNDFENITKNISYQLQRARIGDYVDLMQNPVKLITLNFFAGVARGLGLAVGFAILGAAMIFILQRLVLLNLPIIGGFISQVVKMVQLNIK